MPAVTPEGVAMGREARVLDTEVAYYEAHRAELLQRGRGKFVLIKGSEEIGIFDTDLDAYREGARRFGRAPMFIHQILDVDPVYDFPALRNGIMYAAH